MLLKLISLWRIRDSREIFNCRKRIPELTIFTFVAVAILFFLRKPLHPKILWRLIDSKFALFSQWYGVDDGGMDGKLDTSWCTRCRVLVDRGSSEFF